MGHIYQIRNITNNAVYIGSVLKRNPQDRWVRHKTDLRGNCHHSQHLQRAWNKYGEKSFVFEVLEEVSGNIIPREQWYLDNRKNNFSHDLTYNTCWIAGNCQGRKFSEKTIKKLSESHKGIRMTEVAKEKQQKTWAKKCLAPYSFTSPEGKIYDDVKNLRSFAREHNLGPNGRALTLLHRGNLRSYKGWTKTGNPRICYELVSPNGDVERGFFLKPMCVSKNINYKMIHKYCIKQNRPYRGWTVKCLA